MKLNLPVVVAAVFLLAACSSQSEETSGTEGTGAAPAPAPQVTTQAPVQQPGPPPGSAGDFVVNVGDRVFFDFDKSTLKADGRTQIEGWAAWLKTYPANRVIIEGHADERGTREYNLALGERRANASREYLISLGVDPNRVRTISFGKERPAVPGSTEEAYAQNRRAVAVIEPTTN